MLSERIQGKTTYCVIPFRSLIPSYLINYEDLAGRPKSREHTQIQEKLLIHHERRPHKVSFGCEQERVHWDLSHTYTNQTYSEYLF